MQKMELKRRLSSCKYHYLYISVWKEKAFDATDIVKQQIQIFLVVRLWLWNQMFLILCLEKMLEKKESENQVAT